MIKWYKAVITMLHTRFFPYDPLKEICCTLFLPRLFEKFMLERPRNIGGVARTLYSSSEFPVARSRKHSCGLLHTVYIKQIFAKSKTFGNHYFRQIQNFRKSLFSLNPKLSEIIIFAKSKTLENHLSLFIRGLEKVLLNK